MNLSDQLAVTARNMPEKTAYIFQDKETSYQELEGAIRKFASRMEELGYKKGDHIALVVGNSPYFVISLYGALRLGLVVIPINPLYTANEMTFILRNGDVKAVITMDVLLEKFEGMKEELPDVNHYIFCESGSDVNLEESLLHPILRSFTKLIQEGSSDFKGPELHND